MSSVPTVAPHIGAAGAARRRRRRCGRRAGAASPAAGRRRRRWTASGATAHRRRWRRGARVLRPRSVRRCRRRRGRSPCRGRAGRCPTGRRSLAPSRRQRQVAVAGLVRQRGQRTRAARRRTATPTAGGRIMLSLSAGRGRAAMVRSSMPLFAIQSRTRLCRFACRRWRRRLRPGCAGRPVPFAPPSSAWPGARAAAGSPRSASSKRACSRWCTVSPRSMAASKRAAQHAGVARGFAASRRPSGPAHSAAAARRRGSCRPAG